MAARSSGMLRPLIENCGHRRSETCRWRCSPIHDAVGLGGTERRAQVRGLRGYGSASMPARGITGRWRPAPTVRPVLHEGDQRRGPGPRPHREPPASGPKRCGGQWTPPAGRPRTARPAGHPWTAVSMCPDARSTACPAPTAVRTRATPTPVSSPAGPAASEGFRPAGHSPGAGHHAPGPDQLPLRPHRRPVR